MFIGRETKGVPWSIRISLGMPTRLKIKTSSRTMFADFMEGYCLGVSSSIVDLGNSRCVHVPNQTWEGALQGLCLSAQRAPQLSALGLGDLVEVTEERCVDKLDSTDRTVGLLHPYLANGSGPGASGGCWLPTGAQKLVVIGQTP